MTVIMLRLVEQRQGNGRRFEDKFTGEVVARHHRLRRSAGVMVLASLVGGAAIGWTASQRFAPSTTYIVVPCDAPPVAQCDGDTDCMEKFGGGGGYDDDLPELVTSPVLSS